MFEDKAQGHVEADRARKVVEEKTWTEVTIYGVHPAAVSKIRPPRLQAYLANELRGQLLERGAVVRITDRVARGRARKLFVVEPRPYLEASESEARRLRYLVNLLAKEVVLRNFGRPGDAEVLERMVEVLTYLDPGTGRGR